MMLNVRWCAFVKSVLLFGYSHLLQRESVCVCVDETDCKNGNNNKIYRRTERHFPTKIVIRETFSVVGKNCKLIQKHSSHFDPFQFE